MAGDPRDDSGSIRLGGFDLSRVTGRGGMGAVWQGVHRRSGLPVAVKVLSRARARVPENRSFFRNEVRAVAGLGHPNVIMVFDFGAIEAEAEERSRGALVAGSPYLVMEWASGGTLARVDRLDEWRPLRLVLLRLLDALAHAHAREVVHRDLKPANVLIASQRDLRPGLKLADFGLASRLDEAGHEGGVAGTPAYMAPEQTTGNWRTYGPWTDLYALGCVAYRLVAGHTPFRGSDVLEQQRSSDVPAIAREALARLPCGFETWLRKLLEKDPPRRFRRAADAARNLLALDDDSPQLVTHPPASRGSASEGPQDASWIAQLEAPPPVEQRDDPLRTLGPDSWVSVAGDADRTTPDIGPLISLAGIDLEPGGKPPAHREAHWHGDEDAALDQTIRIAPPVPEAWRRSPEAMSPEGKVMAPGLGLFGLRAIPMVDRDSERDRLWKALHDVWREGQPRMVLLEGPAGFGKSRLAEWLCHRAHELGAANVLKAVHGPRLGPADGLVAMASRFFRCTGLPKTEVLPLIATAFGERAPEPEEADALADLLSAWTAAPEDGSPATPGELPMVTSRERRAVIRAILSRFVVERPVLLWLDDVQWGADALELAGELLSEPEMAPRPVLIVATTRQEALAERELERSLVEKLLQGSRCERIQIGPLDVGSQSILIRSLLGLAAGVAAHLGARTGGNPLFVVQLLGDWVERGLLESGEGGLRFRASTPSELPDNIHNIWTERIVRVLEGYPRSAEECLELAAVLGQDVEGMEWRAVCARAGWEAPMPLVEDLLDLRLARSDPRGPEVGWSFVHGMLRESLERRAREEGRWARHHGRCAEMLRGKRGRGVAERLGRHLLEAGALSGALRPLLDGADERCRANDYSLSLAILAKREGALAALGVADDDRRRAEGSALEALVASLQGRYEAAEKQATRVCELARHNRWDDVLALALSILGRSAAWRGDSSAVTPHFREALEVARHADDPALISKCRAELASALLMIGDHEEAAKQYRALLAAAKEAGDTRRAGTCLRGLACLAVREGRLDDARSLGLDALAHARREGGRHEAAACENTLGEVARMQTDPSSAEDHYRNAIKLWRLVGSGEEIVGQLNLALLCVEDHRFDEGRRLIVPRIHTLQARALIGFLGAARLVLVACSAGKGDWTTFDVGFEQAAEDLARSEYVYPDIARMARLAGDLADDAGETERARIAWRLALSQWRALGRSAEAEEVTARLEALGPPAGV